MGEEFTEALPRSLSRKPLLGRVWNIGSYAGPYFRNDRGSVELKKLQEKGDGSCLPDARILGTRVLSAGFRIGCGRLVSFPDGYRETILAEPVF